MKSFWKRVGLFALINIVLIGLCSVFTELSIDSCIIYSTLVSAILIGIPYEFISAKKQERRPDIGEGVGGAWFGSIGIGAIIAGICILLGKIG